MQAFSTNNLSLAVTLATCGVPFFSNTSPVVNIYDAPILKAMRDGSGRQIYKGWRLEEAALDAWKNKRPGRVAYGFRATPELGEIVKAYNEQEAAIAAIEKNPKGGEAPGEEAGSLDVGTPEAAKLACQILHNRKKLRDAWSVQIPILSIAGACKTETEGGKRVSVGSFKAISLGASAATRKRVGL